MGAPGPPALGDFMNLNRFQALTRRGEGLDDSQVAGGKSIGVAQTAHGNGLGSPVADARQGCALLDEGIQTAIRR